MKKKISLAHLLFLLVFQASVSGQSFDQIKAQVEQELQQRFDLPFDAEVVKFNGRDKYIYQDPYGTLSDSYLIMAKGLTESYDNKNVIGIFKNGQLLWTTEPILAGATFTDFLGSRELNKDNKVELIFGWKLGMNPKGSHLWIISWDGNNGEIINEFDNEGKPEIYASGDVIFYPDYEGDGIYELMTYDFYDENEDSDKVLKIKWNDSKYLIVDRFFDTDLKILDFNRENFSVKTKTHISKTNNKITFTHKIISLTNNFRKIEEVRLFTDLSDYRKVSVPKNRKLFDSRYGFLTLDVDGLDKGRFALDSGDSLMFAYSTRTNIGILKYYIQSINDFPPQATLNATDKEIIYDIKNNSVSGKTLGPWVPESNLSSVAITDSLHSYTTQACQLEWITNKGICRSLQAKLDNVKRQLERGNTKTATNNLQAFLNEVRAVRRNHLTSEGYGLLWFNGQYLLEQLNN